MRNEEGAGEGLELPFLVKTCDLFVYLNLHFHSFQFEEVIRTFVANIYQIHIIKTSVES